MHLGATTEYNRSNSSHSLPRRATPLRPRKALRLYHVHCSLISRAPYRSRSLARHRRNVATPSIRRERRYVWSPSDWPMRPSDERHKVSRRPNTRWRGDVPDANRLSPRQSHRFRCFHHAVRHPPPATQPKLHHKDSSRSCSVCHPNREHPVSPPHPTSRPRCRPKPTERLRRTGFAPITRARSARFRPSPLRRGTIIDTRRCPFGTRYVQKGPRQAGFSSVRKLRAPSRA